MSPWYDNSDYPRPTATDAVELVRSDHTRHQMLLTRMAEDLDTVGMDSVGVFKNFDRRTEHPFYDPTLAADTTMTSTILGTADIYYDAVARRADHEDEAEAKEAALAHWRKTEEHSHAEQGNSDLGIDEASLLLVYGRVYKRILLNPDAESWDNPLHHPPRRPRHLFPDLRVAAWHEDDDPLLRDDGEQHHRHLRAGHGRAGRPQAQAAGEPQLPLPRDDDLDQRDGVLGSALVRRAGRSGVDTRPHRARVWLRPLHPRAVAAGSRTLHRLAVGWWRQEARRLRQRQVRLRLG